MEAGHSLERKKGGLPGFLKPIGNWVARNLPSPGLTSITSRLFETIPEVFRLIAAESMAMLYRVILAAPWKYQLPVENSF
jgi:hypothetical protein